MEKKRSKYSKQRGKAIRKYQKELSKLIREAQRTLYNRFNSLLDDLGVDENGALKRTASNYAKRKDVRILISAFGANEGRRLGRWIYRKVMELFGINKKYFKAIVPTVKESAEERARKRILLDLGYDEKKDEIIKDGWLWGVTNNSRLISDTVRILNNAFRSNTSLKDFRKQFKNFFLGGNGLGQVEKDFYRQTFDIFQSYDRAIGFEYAGELGLKYAIWSGTVKDNTRPFCEARVNQLYDRETIEGWSDLQWKGKKEDNDIFIDMGGHNCRHYLDWISNELAKTLIASNGVNQFN